MDSPTDCRTHLDYSVILRISKDGVGLWFEGSFSAIISIFNKLLNRQIFVCIKFTNSVQILRSKLLRLIYYDVFIYIIIQRQSQEKCSAITRINFYNLIIIRFVRNFIKRQTCENTKDDQSNIEHRACRLEKMTQEKVSAPMLEKNPFDDTADAIVKPYKKRWLILLIYVYYATISCFQWVEYSIITNIVEVYYNVSYNAVNWTGVMFMIVWPIFVFPSSFLIDKLGLRFAALVGCFLTAIGAATKLFSIRQDAFYVVLIGQAIVSLSQVFILSLPPKLAVTWFKPNEVSTVCSLGVFGMQLGSGLGFLIPPMIVKKHANLEDVGANLEALCWGLSLAIVPACLAVVFCFPHQPKYAPSAAQAEERKNVQHVTMGTFLTSLKKLLQNKGFCIHMMGYGICFGIFSAIGTLLNQFILKYFPGAQEDAGRMGLVMIVFGMIGGALVGVILDKTHKYKETNFLIFLMSTISIGGFLFALELKSKWLVYLTIAIFGFFLNAYIPAGIEFATELTYPANESTTTGLLTAVSQTLGVTFTLVLSNIIESMGAFWALGIQVVLLAIGTILTSLTPNKLLRQEAFNKTPSKLVEFTVLPQEEKLPIS